jgi:hypothetical protein
VLNGHAACATALLEHGAVVTDNVKKAGQSGFTLVQHAARNGNKDVVRLLVQRLQEQKMGKAGAAGTESDAAPNPGLPAFHAPGAGSGGAAAPSPAPPSPLSLSATGIAAASTSAAMNGGFITSEEIDFAPHGALPSLGPGGGHHAFHGTCNHAGHGLVACGAADDAACDGLHSFHHSTNHHRQSHLPPPAPVPAGSSNRYDPRSAAGDESGFGSGPGYGSGPVSTMNGYGQCGDHLDIGGDLSASSGAAGLGVSAGAAPGTASRRRAMKDDQVLANRQRERESKRRETEATEARQRLDEAVEQQSIRKLTEAIDHVSKLVLQLGASGGADGTAAGGPAPGAAPSLNGGDDPYAAFATDGGIDTTAGAGAAAPGVGGAAGANPAGSTSQAALASHAVALQMEAGLGLEVQRARKILAGLQAEERRVKEERAREAAGVKRDSNQQLVHKSIAAVLDGGDVRSLTRTVNRARRAILEDEDPAVVEAAAVTTLVVDAEGANAVLATALQNRVLEPLSAAIADMKSASSALALKNGAAAAVRACGGRAPATVIASAEDVYEQLVRERDSAEAEQAAALAQEEAATRALKSAVVSGELRTIERCLEEASSGLLSNESDAASTIEAAKKSLTKSLKSERRKLRQANASKDVDKIDGAVAAATALNVAALEADIATSVQLGALLREQETRRSDLNSAISAGDAQSIAEIRTRLQSLGMFAEAETARSELDNLQKASRARALLSAALKEGQDALASFRAKADPGGAVEEWAWPDGQRMCDLVKRTHGKFGGSLDRLCRDTEQVARDLAAAGRAAVSQAVASGDTRVLAGAIAGYEKSFVNVDSAAMLDPAAGRDALAAARARLAALQAKEQEKVKAEAAQVKTEYALATSRRTVVRQRGARRGRGPATPSVTAPGHSESVASTNSSDDDETLDVDIAMSLGGDDVGRGPPGHLSVNGVVSTAGAGVDGDCSHYYLWRDGTTVQCARCSNVRESVNGEWLQRVKKRGGRAPPEPSAATGDLAPAPCLPPMAMLNGGPSSTGAPVRAGPPPGTVGPPPPAPPPSMVSGGVPVGVKSRVGPPAPPTASLGHRDKMAGFPPMMGNRVPLPPSASGGLAMHQQASVPMGEQQQRQQQRSMEQQRQVQDRQQQEQISRMLRVQAQSSMPGGPPVGHYGGVGGGGGGHQAAQHQHLALAQQQPGGMGSMRGGGGGGGGLRSSRSSGGMVSDHAAAAAVATAVAASSGAYGGGAGARRVALGGGGPPPPPPPPPQSPRQASASASVAAAGAAHQHHATEDAAVDLSMDFANENFGFDIDSLLGKGG